MKPLLPKFWLMSSCVRCQGMGYITKSRWRLKAGAEEEEIRIYRVSHFSLHLPFFLRKEIKYGIWWSAFHRPRITYRRECIIFYFPSFVRVVFPGKRLPWAAKNCICPLSRKMSFFLVCESTRGLLAWSLPVLRPYTTALPLSSLPQLLAKHTVKNDTTSPRPGGERLAGRPC